MRETRRPTVVDLKCQLDSPELKRPYYDFSIYKDQVLIPESLWISLGTEWIVKT